MFRDEARGIAKNSAVLLFQQVLTAGSSALIMLFLPRYLGPIRYGYIFLGTSISQIFWIVTSYGGNYIVTKKVARAPEETARIVMDASLLRLVFAVVSIGATLVIAYYAHYAYEELVVIMLLSVSLIWAGGSTALRAGYQGHELMQYTSAAVVTERLFQVVTILPAIWLKADVITIASLILVGSLSNFLVLVFFSRRIMRGLPPINWKSWAAEIKEGLPYFLFTVFGVIYYRINSLMLSKMSPESVVGWYGGAFRLFEMLNFPSVLTIAIYPVLSRLWKDQERTHQRTMAKSLELVTIGGVYVSVATIAFADKIVGLFYGLEQYGPSVLPFQILCAGLVFLYVDMILGTTLLSSDKQKHLMLISLGAIPLSVLLNVILIPYFEARYQNGAIGASAATGITEVCIMVACFGQLPKESLRGIRRSVYIKSALAGVVMTLVIYLSALVNLHWILKAFLSSAAFFASLWVLRILEPAEQELMKQFFTVDGFRRLLQQMGLPISGITEESSRGSLHE